jgi:hypothetical protein
MEEQGRIPGIKHILAAVSAAAVLLAANGMVMYWSRAVDRVNWQGVLPGVGEILGGILLQTGISILSAAAAGLVVRRAGTRRVIRGSVPLFLLVLVLTGAAVFTGTNDRAYIRVLNVQLNAGALLPLSLFFVAWLVSRYEDYSAWRMVFVAYAGVMIPCAFYMVMYCLPDTLAFCLMFVLLSLRLCRDRRLDRRWRWLMGFGILAFLGMMVYIRLSLPGASARLEVVLTRGQSDPNVEGWFLSQLTSALGEARLIGKSGWMIPRPEGISLPAYLFFAHAGISYAPAALVLRFGWLALLPLLGAAAALILALRGLAGQAGNSFARYYTYGTAALFTARTVLTCIACFLIPMNHCRLPMLGGADLVAVDLILLAAALVLCRKRDALPENLIDRMAPMELLDYLSADMERELTVKQKLLKFILDPFTDEEFPEDWEPDDDEDIPPEDLDLFRRLRGMAEVGPRTGETEAAQDQSALAEELQEKIAGLQAQLGELKKDMDALEGGGASSRELIEKYEPQLVSRAEGQAGGARERSLIFISHSHRDDSYLHMLAERLEARGLNCWYSERDIGAGFYPREIVRAMKRSRVCVVLLTRQANESPHVTTETILAFGMIREGLTIMPLILEELTLSEDLEYTLCALEQTFVRPGQSLEKQLDRFADKVLAVAKD